MISQARHRTVFALKDTKFPISPDVQPMRYIGRYEQVLSNKPVNYTINIVDKK